MIDLVNFKNMMYETMHEWCGILRLYLMCLAWDMSYFEVTCERCESFMEKFLWWYYSVCNDLWIQIRLHLDTLMIIHTHIK